MAVVELPVGLADEEGGQVVVVPGLVATKLEELQREEELFGLQAVDGAELVEAVADGGGVELMEVFPELERADDSDVAVDGERPVQRDGRDSVDEIESLLDPFRSTRSCRMSVSLGCCRLLLR